MTVSPQKRRLARLREQMDRNGVSAFLVSHLPNVFYLSGFTGDRGALLVDASKAILLTDSRFTTQAREELKGTGVRPKIVKGPLASAAAEELIRRKFHGKAAFEGMRMTVIDADRLRKGSHGQIRWRPVAGWVERLRQVKDAEEIERMRDAARLACDVIMKVIPMIKPGVRESELAAEIEYRMRREGASGAAFGTIVASGPRGALPHAQPSDKAIQANELVVIDMGAILRHYCSDITRTVFLGRAPSRVRRWYQAVAEAQAVACQMVRAGAPAEAPDKAARRVLRGYGLARAFVHSTGHGLGIEVHEEPVLGRRQKLPLEGSSVVTVEPGVYLEGIGGIRIEDDLLVLPGGSEILTNAPKDFLEL